MAEKEFNPDTYLAKSGDFNPDTYLGTPPKTDGPSEAVSVGLGGLQGVSMGYSDEAEAAIRALGPRKYEDILKEVRSRYETAQKENPISYGAGEITGGVGSAFLPGIGLAKGVGAAARIGRAGLQGVVAGHGYSTGQTDKEELSDMAMGGAAGVAGGGISEAIPAVGRSLRSGAEKLAEVHLRPTAKVIRGLGGRTKEAAAEALDSKSIKFLRTVDQTAKSIEAPKLAAGNKLEQIVANSNASVSPDKVYSRIESEIINPLKGETGMSGVARRLSKILKESKNKFSPEVGPPAESIPLKLSELEKQQVSSLVDHTPSSKSGVGARQNDALRGMAKIIGQEGELAAKDPQFEAAKKLYGNLSNASKMAKQTASNYGLLRKITDLGVSGEAANLMLSDDPNQQTAGKVLAALYGVTRGRLASSGAVTANALSKLLKSPKTQAAVSGALRTGLIANEVPQSVWERIKLTGE